MGGNYFEQLGREILQQKRRMDKLQEENRELRRQLAELREGRGIFLKIGDQRIALTVDKAEDAMQTKASTPLEASNDQITPTGITSNATPLSEKDQTEETPALTVAEKQPAPANTTRVREVTFLEEVMIDEFASALTTPVPTTAGTEEEHKNVSEGLQERLRRELQGSYLLE